MIDFRKLLKSFRYAFEGIFFAVKLNQNLRIHLLATVVVIIASYILKINLLEASILAIAVILVLTLEMINTAIEEIVDLVSAECREEAKIAKDVGAGMVLIAAIGAVIIGIFIFLPHVMVIFRQ